MPDGESEPTTTTSTTSSSMSGPTTLAEWRKAAGHLPEGDGRPAFRRPRPPRPRSRASASGNPGVMPGADVAEAIRTMTGGQVTGSSFGRRPMPASLKTHPRTAAASVFLHLCEVCGADASFGVRRVAAAGA